MTSLSSRSRKVASVKWLEPSRRAKVVTPTPSMLSVCLSSRSMQITKIVKDYHLITYYNDSTGERICSLKLSPSTVTLLLP